MSELPAPHTWKAPAHDPLCRQQHWEGGDCFDCRLIAKVRADERKQVVAEYVPVLMAHLLQRTDLRAQVEALPVLSLLSGNYVNLDDVLALPAIGGGDE